MGKAVLSVADFIENISSFLIQFSFCGVITQNSSQFKFCQRLLPNITAY